MTDRPDRTVCIQARNDSFSHQQPLPSKPASRSLGEAELLQAPDWEPRRARVVTETIRPFGRCERSGTQPGAPSRIYSTREGAMSLELVSSLLLPASADTVSIGGYSQAGYGPSSAANAVASWLNGYKVVPTRGSLAVEFPEAVGLCSVDSSLPLLQSRWYTCYNSESRYLRADGTR